MGLIREISSYKLGLPASDLNQYKEIPVGQISFEDITTAFVKMLRIVLVQGLLVANVVLANEEKFQKCCGEEKLYSPKDRSCHTPTSQGPCQNGEWFVMARDNSGMGVCEKAPCKNNQMILVEGGGCTSKYDTSQCSRGTRPWYSCTGTGSASVTVSSFRLVNRRSHMIRFGIVATSSLAAVALLWLDQNLFFEFKT